MQRTLVLGALWTASAGAAVGLGFLAVSLVGASASPGPQPVASSTTTTQATPTPEVPVSSATGEHSTVGGTVYADCTTGSPVLAGAPAAGWWIDDSNDVGEVEFENGSLKVEVYVSCVDGSPSFVVEGPRADSSGGGGHGSDDSGGDDSSGPGGGGGGHGSDD